MNHWLSMLDWKPDEVARLAARAAELKGGADAGAIRGKLLTLLFFNPSLRTRVSFEAAMLRFGGHAITLSPGSDAWKIEFEDGVVMNLDKAEHIKEAAPVISRYCDALAVRSFAKLQSFEDDRRDQVLNGFAAHATVPVINMESATEHPCQALGDMLTLGEKLGNPAGKRFTLAWAPHVAPLPLAVPHSAVLAAAMSGMSVTIAHPEGYGLAPHILNAARSLGVPITVTDDQADACRQSDVVYAKSWGSPDLYCDRDAQTASFRDHADWTVGEEKLGSKTILMHCLPVRRNLVVSDGVLDGPKSVVVDQAENRLWAQAAILERLFTDAN